MHPETGRATTRARRSPFSIAVHLGVFALGLVVRVAQAQVPLARSPLDSVKMPFAGAADGAEPWGVVTNPATLGALRGWNLGLLHTETNGQNRFAGRGTGAYFASPLPYLRAIQVGTALEVLRPHDEIPPLGKWTLAVSYQPIHWAAVGLSYGRTFSSSGPNSFGDLDTLSVGLHLRGNRRFAVGLMARDLNTPGPLDQMLPEISRSYEVEALWAPLGDSRWDIGLALRIGEENLGISPRVRMWVRPVAGLGFGIDGSSVWEKDQVGPVAWRVGLGVAVDFARFGASVFQLFGAGESTPVAYHGGSVAVRISEERYPSLWSGPKGVLRLHLGEAKGRVQLRQLLAMAEQARGRRYKGVLVFVNQVAGGWAMAHELRQALLAFRQSGQRVVAYAAELDMREYFIASAADEILLDPAGLVRLSGIAQATMHYKDVLNRVGVTADLVRMGDYKASPESFVLAGPTEKTRLVRQKLVDDFSSFVVAEIAKSRGISPADVQRMVQTAQFVPAAAKTARLVDDVADQVQLHGQLQRWFGANVRVENLPQEPRPQSTRPHGVAIIEVRGDLLEGQSFHVPYVHYEAVGAQTLSAALSQAEADPRIEAVVLRIDSPGGSALAADLLARQVKQLNGFKPVVCSFGDMAASGGYYLAAPCREIFADPLTITGSIGVFGGKIDVSGLLSRVGIERARYVSGPHADMETPFRSYTAEERELLTRRMQQSYERFLNTVKDGRRLSTAELLPYAEGRVLGGQLALQGRLIDRMGGLSEALARARELADLVGEKDSAVIFLPEQPKTLASQLLGVASELASHSAPSWPGVLQQFARLMPSVVWALSFSKQDVFARLEQDPAP